MAGYKLAYVESHYTEDLETGITEAGKGVSRKALRNIANHSVNNFQKCLNKEPL